MWFLSQTSSPNCCLIAPTFPSLGQSPVKEVMVLCLTYQQGSWGWWWVSNWPEVPSPVKGGTGMRAHHPTWLPCLCPKVAFLVTVTTSAGLPSPCFGVLALPLTLCLLSLWCLQLSSEDEMRDDVAVSCACCSCCCHRRTLSPLS